ncbi:MAG TPA: glutamate 5-kinase [Acidiferrobacteraceae bacterium]|nr:glutamate 5-kinase [Acidiferrobacteraceae bacterium]
MNTRHDIVHTRRWVVKIGSALLTDTREGLNQQAIAQWVDQMAVLRRQGIELIMVSSGAVVEGMKRLGWQQRPGTVNQLQAAAAVGQMGLIQEYESAFQRYDLHTAQVLLTHDDLAGRTRYLNARSTLRTLLDLGVIPVVNENDTVVVDEIRFGDNDTLAAMVVNLIEADLLVILTDQAGLYDKDPRQHGDAKLVREADAGDTTLAGMASTGGSLGRGGMVTKLQAAAKAARSGAATVIAAGTEKDVLLRIAAGKEVGTVLWPATNRIAARKQWLAGQLQVSGRLTLDDGAVEVLREDGRSLLAVGVTHVDGGFSRGELVVCLDPNGQEVARGLVNYSANETQRIAGHSSESIKEILGYVDEAELIHRDNLVLV